MKVVLILVAGWLTLASICGAADLEIAIVSPEPDVAVFGEVDFSVVVSSSEPIRSVDFWVDDEYVASAEAPPYRTPVNVGDENRPHKFVAVANTTSGSQATAYLVTPEVVIDLEMNLWLQQLYVSVTLAGEPVLDLEKSDFSVMEDGLDQDLITFERGDVPMTMVLLIDLSGSMRGERFAASLQAARGLLSRMNPLDEVMVMVFSDRVLGMTDFRSGTATLPPEFEDLKPSGGTALNDHLYAALELLEGRQGRPVVILLSDGVDTLSLLRMEDVLWRTRRSNALIYRIHATPGGVGGVALANVWRDLNENLEERRNLELAIEETGGRIRALARNETLEDALESVLEELRQQYVLGYYPTSQERDGSWRTVQVTAGSPELSVRTRSGYFDNRKGRDPR